MLIKPIQLAKRLAVTRQAIGQAIQDGRLTRRPDGLVDTDDEQNRSYLGRFTAHRGKSSDKAPASPERAAAILARARASYGKTLQKFEARRKTLVPRENADASIAAAVSALRDELAKIADRVNLSAKPLEIELERVTSEVCEFAFVAMRKAFFETEEDAPESVILPDEVPEGSTLDQVRALIDTLAAKSMNMDSDTADGFNITWESCTRRYSALNEQAFRLVLSWPRRSVARIAAAMETEGMDAARRLVASLAQDEITRLKGVTA